ELDALEAERQIAIGARLEPSSRAFFEISQLSDQVKRDQAEEDDERERERALGDGRALAIADDLFVNRAGRAGRVDVERGGAGELRLFVVQLDDGGATDGEQNLVAAAHDAHVAAGLGVVGALELLAGFTRAQLRRLAPERRTQRKHAVVTQLDREGR